MAAIERPSLIEFMVRGYDFADALANPRSLALLLIARARVAARVG
jgi:hypothetical protein